MNREQLTALIDSLLSDQRDVDSEYERGSTIQGHRLDLELESKKIKLIDELMAIASAK